MEKLIRFLMDNPILLLILVAWVAGMVGNIGKAAKKARERTEQARSAPPPQQPPAQQPQPRARPVEPGSRSAEEVAAEMRRILGLEPEGKEEGQNEPPPHPRAQRPLSEGPQRPRAEAPQVGRREVVAPERPPTPVKPSTQERRLATHVDPHVGERITRRQSVQSGFVGKKEPGSALGSLGGRVSETARVRRTAVRFALDDLQKALVLNEILGKPLALRDPGDRFV